MSDADDACLNFIRAIDQLTFSADDWAAEERLYELTDRLEDVVERSSIFEAIFRFFERNEGARIGNPGPLVHLIEESYPAYLDPLVESVRRKPVEHTVWMVNRILNESSISQGTRSLLLRLLEETRDNQALANEIRQSAGEFLWHQERKIGSGPRPSEKQGQAHGLRFDGRA